MGRRGVRGAIVLTVASSLVVGATACKPEIAKEVLFVNDSVTHQSVTQIVQEFNAVAADAEEERYAPNFGSSVPGIGLLHVPGVAPEDVDEYWVAHLTSVIEHVDPEVILVELGYNDCALDLSDYGDRIDAFMALVPTGTPVHWLTMHDVNDQQTCDEVINEELDDATGRWANLTLIDFAAHMDGHPEWTDDGRHLSDAGKAEYAIWLHAELDARYGQPEPEPEPQAESAAVPN